MGTVSFWINYISFLLRAQTEYNLHSPFIYDFYVKVVLNKYPYLEYKQIKEFEKKQRDIETSNRKLQNNAVCIHKGEEMTPLKSRKLLFRIARYFKPHTMIEIGTSNGMLSQYLAWGNRGGKVFTLTNCQQMANKAKVYFEKNNFQNINILLGESYTSSTLATIEKKQNIGIVFFNINNPEETISLFQQILPHAQQDTVFIFNNIHHSKEINATWESIKQHPQVKISIDLFYLGILFLKKELSKQDFILRF